MESKAYGHTETYFRGKNLKHEVKCRSWTGATKTNPQSVINKTEEIHSYWMKQKKCITNYHNIMT